MIAVVACPCCAELRGFLEEVLREARRHHDPNAPHAERDYHQGEADLCRKSLLILGVLALGEPTTLARERRRRPR